MRLSCPEPWPLRLSSLSLLFVLVACGDEEVTEDESLGEPLAELVGRWSGDLEGTFSGRPLQSSLEFRLIEDGTVSDGAVSSADLASCSFRTAAWGVRDGVFRFVGNDCDGTTVSLEANASPVRMRGNWEGQPSGNRGTFDISKR